MRIFRDIPIRQKLVIIIMAPPPPPCYWPGSGIVLADAILFRGVPAARSLRAG